MNCSHKPAHLSFSFILEQSATSCCDVNEYEPQNTDPWALRGLQNDGVSEEFMTHSYFWCRVLIHLSVSLCCCVWTFSWKLSERSPQVLWISGICEVGLATFVRPPCKSFLAREGVLTLFCSDPGILKPTERFTGWVQRILSSLSRDGHPASSRVTKARRCTWVAAQEPLNLSAGQHSAWIIRGRIL